MGKSRGFDTSKMYPEKHNFKAKAVSAVKKSYSPKLLPLFGYCVFLGLFLAFAYRVWIAYIRLDSGNISTLIRYEETAERILPSVTVYR